MYCVRLIWYRCMQINSIFSIINISNECCAIIILSHSQKRRSKAESSLTYLLLSFLPSFLPSFFLDSLPSILLSFLPSFHPSFYLDFLPWLPSLTYSTFFFGCFPWLNPFLPDASIKRLIFIFLIIPFQQILRLYKLIMKILQDLRGL